MDVPRRIVSLVPSTTETVWAVGAGDRLVGCTRYCTQPAAELATTTRLGGTKNPDRERLAALAPDLVLANAEENRAEDLEWLRQRFPLLVQTPRSVPQARAAVLELGAALAAAARAEALAGAIDDALARAAAVALPRVRGFYAIWPKPWMGVNRDTYIHDVLARAGLDDVCAAAAERYPVVEPRAIVDAGARVVLLPTEPWQFTAGQRQELRATGVFADARLLLCDGRDFCWHGAHSAAGLLRASELLSTIRRAPDS